MKLQTLPVLAVVVCALALPALAADWPQWRGPDRTAISSETGLLKAWPKEGPPLLWTYRDAGTGYSGPAIVGDRFFTAGARNDAEYVYCLDVRTGKALWSTALGPIFPEGHADGPRGTPTVDGELLYVLGGQGELVCVETGTGKKHWNLNLKKDLNGSMMSGWGYCESPLVDGEKVVVSPGGSGGTLAALDKRSGKVIWRSKGLTDQAAYSSIMVADIGGIRQYIQMTGIGVAGVAAQDGRLLWHYPKKGVYRTAVIPTPIVHDNHVYATAGYGAGCDCST
jgi:outer membrane protein assembly factor BamB